MSAPAISVGVPVYNGGALLDDALGCLARQDAGDFEVVVSDNASTDGSGDLAERYAARDPRFRVIRQPRNIGPLPNFHAVVREARGAHFLWRAHDDLSSPDYLSRLSRVLTAQPEVDLAIPRAITLRIGRARKRIHRVPRLAADPAGRLAQSQAGWFYGMWRRAVALDSIEAVIAGYDHLWAWDHLMLFPVLLSGRVAGDDRALFFHRLNRQGDKAARPSPPAVRAEMRAQYARFCQRQIERSGLTGAGEAALRRALDRHMSRRVARR